jgi:hypothetical protein
VKNIIDYKTRREWEVEVVPLVVGQRSVSEKEWVETLKIFGMGQKMGRKSFTD